MTIRLRFQIRTLWLLTLASVVVGSLLPASSAPLRALDALNVSDKLVHFSAYLILMFLPALHERRLVTALLAFGLVLLGALLEFGQMLIPGRSPEVGDAVANLLGVLCGLVTAALARAVLVHLKPGRSEETFAL